MRYLPHTPEDITAMLETIGKPSIDRLFETIPEAARFSVDAPFARSRAQEHGR